MKTPTRILLLGLGYVSVWTYKNLLKQIPNKIKSGEVQITVVSTSDYHAFHGFTGEFLAGMLPVDLRRTPQERLLKHAHFIHGEALHIDQEKQEVRINNFGNKEEEQISFDHLVIGIGTVDQEENISGIKAYGLSVKKENGIRQCRQRIIQAVEAASQAKDEEKIKALLHFVVAGGGFAGVEVCGNLCEYLRELATIYPILREHAPSVSLIHSGAVALPQLAADGHHGLIRYCMRQLTQAGVEIISNTRIQEVQKDALILSGDRMIPTHTAICCIGQRMIPLSSSRPFVSDIKGRIETTRQLNAQGYNNIWAGGDAARVMHVSGKKECRSDALWAIKAGTRIGKNIARSIQGKKLRKFNFPGMGQTASLSKNKAVLELYGIRLTGFLAWWIRLGFFLYYMPHYSQAIKAIQAFIKPRRLWELSEMQELRISDIELLTHDPKCEAVFSQSL